MIIRPGLNTSNEQRTGIASNLRGLRLTLHHIHQIEQCSSYRFRPGMPWKRYPLCNLHRKAHPSRYNSPTNLSTAAPGRAQPAANNVRVAEGAGSEAEPLLGMRRRPLAAHPQARPILQRSFGKGADSPLRAPLPHCGGAAGSGPLLGDLQVVVRRRDEPSAKRLGSPLTAFSLLRADKWEHLLCEARMGVTSVPTPK